MGTLPETRFVQRRGLDIRVVYQQGFQTEILVVWFEETLVTGAQYCKLFDPWREFPQEFRICRIGRVLNVNGWTSDMVSAADEEVQRKSSRIAKVVGDLGRVTYLDSSVIFE